jgi:hypothetical protein
MAITVPAVGDPGTASWADAVAAQLNVSPIMINGASNVPTTSAAVKLQSGSFTSVFNNVNATSGTLTYPTAFAAAPIVIATVQIGANLDVLINWQSISITAAPWRLFNKSGTSIGTPSPATATVHWLAIGT